MKITDTGNTGSARKVTDVRKRSGASAAQGVDFADYLSLEDTGSALTAEAPAAVANVGLDAVLFAQEVSEEEQRRHKAVRQGVNILDSLEQLRHSLLMGRVPVTVLRTIEARLVEQRIQTADPALHAIMDDIELRAAVELAKFEAAVRDSGTF